MAKLLLVNGNPHAPEHSFSLTAANAFLETYKESYPGNEVEELHLYEKGVPLIDGEVLTAMGKMRSGGELTHSEQAKLDEIADFTDQFIAADHVVFVTSLWNFSLQPLMKAYIDTICQGGKTFRYTENGPVGLMSDKKVVHIQARGGVYSSGPMAEWEFGDRYLRTVMKFLGISDVQSVILEGMAAHPDRAENIKQEGIRQAVEAAKAIGRKPSQIA